MDITVYLPDDIGERAKAADLPFSRLLRGAVLEELEKRAALEETLEGARTVELEIEDPRRGGVVTGRFTGREIGGSGDATVYVTEDGRVLAYDEKRLRVQEVEDPAEELRDWLPEEEYFEAMSQLGLRPVVEL